MAEPTLRKSEDRPADASAPPPVAARSAPGGRRLELYDDLAAVAPLWQAFERDADCTVFQDYNWLAAWQRHIGTRLGTQPAIVLMRDASARLSCILQLAVERKRITRRLTWLGSDLCDYNAPLLAPDFERSVPAGEFAALWREIAALVREAPRLRFALVDLQKMPERVGGQRNPFLDLPVIAHPSGAYIATLGEDWEAYYAAKRSSATRKRERRQLKHLAEHGEVRFVDVEDRDDIARTLDTMLAQKSRAFARMGVKNIFAQPGYREFYLDLATDMNVRALTHISRLDVGALPAAANLGLRFRNSYYLVLSSYHDGEIARFGPGRAHLHELMRHAIEQGFERFDFTVGDEPYKRDWSDTELKLVDYLEPATLRGSLAAARTLAYRRAKRVIKQTPLLWSLFSRARAYWASWRAR